MIDPTGAVITEIRGGTLMSMLTDRVRGFEPAPEDLQPPGNYKRFVVVVGIDVPPDPRLPITDAHFVARCYGTTPQDAFLVYSGVVDAIHGEGPRVKNSGLGIYQSFIETGGTTEKDPDTQQPYVTATIHLVATTQAVA